MRAPVKLWIIIAAVAAASLWAASTAAAQKEVKFTKVKGAVVRFEGDVRIMAVAPEGWRKKQSEECIESETGKRLCARVAAASGMKPCEWGEAAARHVDAPGDDRASITAIPISGEEVAERGAKAGCFLRVISPALQSVVYRIVFLRDERFYFFVTNPMKWGADIDEAGIARLERGMRIVANSAAFQGSLGYENLEAVNRKRSGRPDFDSIKAAAQGHEAPDRPQLLLDADYLRLTGKLKQAEEKYNQAMQQHEYDALVGLGDLASTRMDYGQAASYYSRALELDPSKPDAYNGLGSIKLLEGDTEAAKKLYWKALEKSPQDPSTLSNLGWLAFRRGLWSDAESYFMKALARAPGPDAAVSAINGLSEISFHYGEYEEAVAWNRSMLAHFPDYPEAHANILRAYLSLGLVDKALKEAEIIEKIRPGAPGTKILAGRAYYAAGEYEAAAARLCPFVSGGGSGLGMDDTVLCADALKSTGQLKPAIAVMTSAITAPASAPEHYLLLAGYLRDDGNMADALKILGQGISRFPDNQDLLKMKAELAGRNK